jgi:hypothetical protein
VRISILPIAPLVGEPAIGRETGYTDVVEENFPYLLSFRVFQLIGGKAMFKRLLFVCGIAICFGFSCRTSMAQQVVHALTGTVSSIDPVSKTITLFLDGGSQGVFKDMESKTSLSVDKRVLVDATAVDAFKQKGAYVIVLYFGGMDLRTAVALRSLGTGPFSAIDGTVARFESREHAISVEDKSGTVQTFKINADTVAEGYAGAVDGLKFQAQKDDHVHVVGTSQNGSLIALFVSEK